ncbi:MAG TPA: ATP-binding protein [Candidatus Binatia bacterium]
MIHEIASPLGGMVVGIDLLEKYLVSNPGATRDIGDLLELIKKETERLNSLLQELRSSRVFLNLNPRLLSIGPEVNDFLGLELPYHEQHRIRVERDISATLPPIMADPAKLRQVLLNLCNNAVEAMRDGGTLAIRSYLEDSWLCLDISDTGSGIPDNLPIFEPGVTTKPDGTGLGLLIVGEIMDQHGGMVSYASDIGAGTTFHLKFPLPE